MAVHGNLINGEWVTGADVNRDVNPSNLQEVVGEYARADAAQAQAAIAAPRGGLPGLVARQSAGAGRPPRPRRGRDPAPRRRSWAPRSPARRERRSPRGSARPSAPATSSGSSPARSCGRTGSCSTPSAPASRWRSRASRSASSGIITPWNFPLAIPAWKIAPALAYGNCVVFKPADLVPGCAWALADILQRAGVPAGVFNLVMGRGSAVGEALDRLRPTSTASASRAPWRRAAPSRRRSSRRMGKIQLEMGARTRWSSSTTPTWASP